MAANIQFVDYAAGRTLGALGTGTTSIQLAAGQGALFPAAGGGLYFYATLVDIETGGFNQHEVVRVTNKVGDLLTVVRGSGIIDGTPQAWPAGSGIECRDCAQALTDLAAGGGGGGAPTNSPYVLVSPDASLPNRRILTGSATVGVADGGPTGPITLSIPVNAVDNTRLAQMPANTIKGNNTAGLANAADLTAAQAAAIIGAITSVGGTVTTISAGTIASRPAPGIAGRVWLATDDGSISRDTGAAWFVLEPAMTGDVTSVPGLSATTIAAHAVTNAKLAQMAGATFKANPLGSTGDAQDIPGASAINLMPVFGPSGAPSKGIVPAPGAVAGIRQFLREDTTWAIPSGWWFNVKDFGAVGDGATDDTAAINAAYNAIPANGAVLYFPYGVYKVSAALTPWNKAMTVMGDGWAASTISTNSATLDVVTVQTAMRISNMRFWPSVARTAGHEINITAGSQITIDNCQFNAYFIGVGCASGGAALNINHCQFSNATPGSGVGIDITGGISASQITETVIGAAPGSAPQAGIRITSCGDLTISACSIVVHVAALLISPGTGKSVGQIYCVGCFFDTSGNGLLVQPTGTGLAEHCTFTNCWFGNCTAQGARIIGGGTTTVNGFDFVDCHILMNVGNGLQVDAGALNVRFIGGEVAQNTGDGLQFNTTDFAVIGARIGTAGGLTGNTGYGVNVNVNTADRFVVTANDLTGNSLGGLNNLSTQTNWITGQNLADTGTFFVTGKTIKADFSNPTLALITAFQTSSLNNNTFVNARPNGLGNSSGWRAVNNSDPTAPQSFCDLRIGLAAAQFFSGNFNGGTNLPIRMVIANGTNATEWSINGDLQHKFGIADQGYSLQVPVTGFTITIPDHCSDLFLNPAGVLATGTITMPANPVDGQLVRLATTQTVTALTLNANAGQTISGNVTTLGPTAPASYMYVLSLLKWLKVGS